MDCARGRGATIGRSWRAGERWSGRRDGEHSATRVGARLRAIGDDSLNSMTGIARKRVPKMWDRAQGWRRRLGIARKRAPTRWDRAQGRRRPFGIARKRAPTGRDDDPDFGGSAAARGADSDDTLEVDGVGLEGVPLADDHVAVGEHADVVAMVDDGPGARECGEVNAVILRGGRNLWLGVALKKAVRSFAWQVFSAQRRRLRFGEEGLYGPG